MRKGNLPFQGCLCLWFLNVVRFYFRHYGTPLNLPYRKTYRADWVCLVHRTQPQPAFTETQIRRRLSCLCPCASLLQAFKSVGRAAFRIPPFFCFISLPSLPHSSNIDQRLQCHVRHAVLNLALKRIAAVFPFHIAAQKHSCGRSKKIKNVWLFYILIVLLRSVNCTNSHPYPAPYVRMKGKVWPWKRKYHRMFVIPITLALKGSC